MTARIRLPEKKKIIPTIASGDKPSTDSSVRSNSQPFRFSLPTRPTTTHAASFEKGATYTPTGTFKYGGNTFEENEQLEVIGSRRSGPTAALEIIFRNTKTGAKKFFVLHQEKNTYHQTQFMKVS
jgi:hypothetical protein